LSSRTEVEAMQIEQKTWGLKVSHEIVGSLSSLSRIPNSYNLKCINAGKKDAQVKIQQRWDGIRVRPSREFMRKFHAYMVQQVIDGKVEKLERRNRLSTGLSFKNMNSMPWIDKLLQTGIEDNRKGIIFWVLAPYLITVKGLDYDKAYSILEQWLEKCDAIRRLELGWTAFRYKIRYCLDTAENQERKPIKFDTFKEHYPDVYKALKLSEGV
jgi:non-catalytic primase subunit PriX-like protein